MWSKTIVILAICCALLGNLVQAYPSPQSQGQEQGPCGPPPNGPRPSGPPPSGMSPKNGKGGPCGPPPSGGPPTTAATSG